MTFTTSGPRNPYAPSEPAGDMGAIRERVRGLEVMAHHLGEDQAEIKATQRDHGQRLTELERIGREAIMSLPEMIGDETAHLEHRVHLLEQGWFAPLKPHLWKVYAAIGTLVLARIWKLATGEALDVIKLIELIAGRSGG
jgi:hypothetical protein